MKVNKQSIHVYTCVGTNFISINLESNPWVISNSIYSKSEGYLEQLRSYTTAGHSYEALLTSGTHKRGQSVTVLLPIYSKESLSKLDAVLGWTEDIALQISIICASQFKPMIDEKIKDASDIKATVVDRSTHANAFAPGTAGASIWLQVLNIDDIKTEYVYIMDETIVPSPYSLKELEYLFYVNQLEDYKNALIGTRGFVLSEENYCLPIDTSLPVDKAQPADMLMGAWLLHKSWLPFVMTDLAFESLSLPLGHYISLNLDQQLNIPTIVLPIYAEDRVTNSNKQLCEQAQAEWSTNVVWRDLISKNRYPTVLQYRSLTEHGAMVVAQGYKQLIALHPLLCRFKQYPVHLVILGDLNMKSVQHALKETNCNGVQIHDFTAMKDRHEDTSIGRLVKVIQPRVLIQIKQEATMYHAIKTIAKMYQVTEIGLPEKEIVHALWIPDLSLDALQCKSLSRFS